MTATETTNLRTSALAAIEAAVSALVVAQRGVPRAIAVAQKHGLTGDEIRQAFEREGLDFADVLPLVQGYVEKEDVL